MREVAVGDCADHTGHLTVGPDDVFDEVVHGVEGRRPAAARAPDRGALDLAFLADPLAEAAELTLEQLIGFDDVVDHSRHPGRLTRRCHGDPDSEIPALDRGQDPEQHPGVDAVCG